MNHGAKILYYLVENLYLSLNCLNKAYLANPGPIFRQFLVKIGRPDQKKIFYLIVFIFQTKRILILIGLLALFHMEQSNFENIYWLLGYTQKCMKNCNYLTLPKMLYFRIY